MMFFQMEKVIRFAEFSCVPKFVFVAPDCAKDIRAFYLLAHNWNTLILNTYVTRTAPRKSILDFYRKLK